MKSLLASIFSPIFSSIFSLIFSFPRSLVLSLILILPLTPPLSAQANILYSFLGAPDGSQPYSALIPDHSGGFYGSTEIGGTGPCTYLNRTVGCGTIFHLTPDGHGGWDESILYSFQDGDDGAYPMTPLTIDSSNNLYGTTIPTTQSCPPWCGIVYRLTPQGEFTILHTFSENKDSAFPITGVILDSSGNLYGTTGGFHHGQGTLFELANDGNWTLTNIKRFDGGAKQGGLPEAPLVFDSSGNLYGALVSGGKYGYGGVFQLHFDGQGRTGWQSKFIHWAKDPIDNTQQLLFGSDGTLYARGSTLIFSLKPVDGKWKYHYIHKFKSAAYSFAVDSGGNLYSIAGGLYLSSFDGTKWHTSELNASLGGGGEMRSAIWFDGVIYGTFIVPNSSGAGGVWSYQP